MKKNTIFIAVIVLLILVFTLIPKLSSDKDKQEPEENATYQSNEEGKTFYELGDTINVHLKDMGQLTEKNVDICVTKAEISEELYDEYGAFDSVKRSIESSYSNEYATAFLDELRYIYVDFSVENNYTETATIDLTWMGLYNKYEDLLNTNTCREGVFFYVYDDGFEETPTNSWNECFVTVSPGEKLYFRALYVVKPNTLYDVYFSTAYIESLCLETKYVRLDIAPYETGDLTFRVGEGPYDSDKRDAKAAKIRNNVINYDFFLEQQAGYDFLDKYFYDFDSVVGKAYEQAENDRIPGMELNILEAELYEDMNMLPDVFTKNTYLEDMTKLYIERLSNSADEYRYLYVKVKMKELGNMDEMFEDIDQYMWIYNRDKNGKLWRIGYPDDYYIISATNKNQYLGSYKTAHMWEGDEIVVEAVYVITPDTVYDIYMFNSYGPYNEYDSDYYGNEEFDMIYGGISLDLNLKEEGGVKQ